MFIGQPRSGTSLLGSLLNAHPNMLVAQELNALKYLRRGYSRKQIYWLIKRNEELFARNGRQWTGYEYAVDNAWQGNWEELLVIGDKKAGRSTEELSRRPDLLKKLQESVGVPVRIVHVVRNPFNVITTIYRKVKNANLEQASKMYFRRCETNWQLMQQGNDRILTFRLEDFIATPQKHLANLCQFLNVPEDQEFILRSSRTVFDKPRNSMFDAHWDRHLVDNVRKQMQRYPFLHGYDFQTLSDAA